MMWKWFFGDAVVVVMMAMAVKNTKGILFILLSQLAFKFYPLCQQKTIFPSYHHITKHVIHMDRNVRNCTHVTPQWMYTHVKNTNVRVFKSKTLKITIESEASTRSFPFQGTKVAEFTT